MGANQSSPGDASSQPAAGEPRTSYYELLGLERQATDDEIRRAYRRKALELHPDRNYGNAESATELFAEVQAAYEVLSDPQERAWYDSHEAAILRGGGGGGDDDAAGEAQYERNVRVTTAEEVMGMLRKFHGGIDYSDAPSGFFGFLRDTFAALAREEDAAAEWEGLDAVDYPSFGHKDDAYEDVVRPFYAAWSGFATRKTFSWKDKYRLSEAPDRRYRRAMEKENKRLRDEGVREFNDAVRTLVAFVRKRDPRYAPNTQSEADRQKALRDAAAAQAARSRAANEAKMREQGVPEWTKARDPEEEQQSEEEDIEEEQFECVACHKTFKSDRQFDAHEKSKKHQKAVHALRKKMRKENKHLNLDEDVPSSGFMTPASTDEGEELDEAGGSQDDNANGTVEPSDDPTIEQERENSGVDEPENVPTHPDGPSTNPSSRAQTDESSTDDEDHTSRPNVSARLSDLHLTDSDAPPPAVPPSSAPAGPKTGRAAQKRAKRAAQQAAAEQSDARFKCATCNAAFPSKTRLFQHIKDFGHAAPVQKVAKGATGKGKR